MCLVALYFRACEDAPLVVGANREEDYARPGEPPQILPGVCRAVAGLDPRGGGTWLGVNEFGVLIAVTNRAKSNPPAQPRSRGLLVRDLLGSRTAAHAADKAAAELGQNLYTGCNLICADGERAVIVHGGDWLRVRFLPPGLHVLANHDINDGSDRRVGHALWWLGQRPYATAKQCLDALRDLCSQPGGPHGPPMTLHGEKRGTVSSTLVALRASLAKSVYLHAQGPPDRTPYDDYSSLLHQLATPAPAAP